MIPPSALSPTALAVVALGSNLGDPVATLREAMQTLRTWSAGPWLASALWRTEPVDCPPGSPPFVNAVVAFAPPPQETPLTLLRKLLALEQRFGPRPRVEPNAPRRLDLDLIAFGPIEICTPELVLPHPRAAQRRFVLAPLAEILPDLQLPGWPAPAAELLSALPAYPVAVRLPD